MLPRLSTPTAPCSKGNACVFPLIPLPTFPFLCVVVASGDYPVNVGQIGVSGRVWSRILRYLGSCASLGFGYWAVEERTTCTFVGEVGLCNLQRDLTPPLGDLPEMAGPSRQPARERLRDRSCSGCSRLVFHSTQMDRMHHPHGNKRSLRVAGRLGFVVSHMTSYRNARSPR